MKQNLVSTIIDKNEIPDTRYFSDDSAWLHRISKDTFIEGINWMIFKQLGKPLKKFDKCHTRGGGNQNFVSHTKESCQNVFQTNYIESFT